MQAVACVCGTVFDWNVYICKIVSYKIMQKYRRFVVSLNIICSYFWRACNTGDVWFQTFWKDVVYFCSGYILYTDQRLVYPNEN